MSTWDKVFYKDVEKTSDPVFRIPHKKLPQFVQLLREIDGENILDLGCGTGRHVVALAKEGFTVCGIDISKKAIRVAREWLDEERLQATITGGDIYQPLPYPDNYFDGVISIKAMHHATLKEINRLIKELKRVMRGGGILMIEVPRTKKRSRWKHKEIEQGTVVPLEGPEKGIPHRLFASEGEFTSLFPDFEILDVHGTGQDKSGTPSPHFTMFAKLKEKA